VAAAGPRFTVIVPAYNAAGTIERCLRSILDQTFGDFELIVVDDASTDSTAAIVASLSDSRVRLIRGERNAGPSVCRNRALRSARGISVLFADADDWLEPEFLAAGVAAADRGGNPDLLVTRYQIVSDSGIAVDRQRFGGGDPLQAFLEDRIALFVWGKVYQRAIIEEHKVRFPDLRLSEDSVFNARYLAHARTALLIDGPPLYNYEARWGSVTRGTELGALLDAAERALALTGEALGSLRPRYARALEVRAFRMIAIQSIRRLAREMEARRLDDRLMKNIRARVSRRFGWRSLARPELRYTERLAYAAFMAAPRLALRALARRER
jgi:hypothetical protein